jgi:hypothetical protein
LGAGGGRLAARFGGVVFFSATPVFFSATLVFFGATLVRPTDGAFFCGFGSSTVLSILIPSLVGD